MASHAGKAGAGATARHAAADGGATAVMEDIDWKIDLLRSVGEECQTEADLRKLVEKKPNFVLYDGFEPSGRMHIAQGVFKTLNVNKWTKAGGTFIFWVADWFALMNDKMGGDIEKIRTVGKYLIEVWKASGMDMSRVKFLWSSEEISKRADEYWGHALDIAQRSTLARIKKCCQIMGRDEDSLTAAQILYPIMQCADIFFLRADICQLGVDQRKVNMLARDYCDASGRKLKPIILSHHMLYGLKKGQAKMSKSDPDSAIFMEDAPEDVERKLLGAYCPTEPDAGLEGAPSAQDMNLSGDKLKNPCLDYIRYVLFSREGFKFDVGGTVYPDYESFEQAFVGGTVGEDSLKDALIGEVNQLLSPVRDHFESNAEARSLLEQVAAWRRETLEPTKSFFRLALPTEAASRFIVFAPFPAENVKLQHVCEVMHRLSQAPAGSKPVLWLPDWSARAQGCLAGKSDCIKAFYSLLLHGLEALAPATMEAVEVLWQGDAILSGPEDYWTSVINAGRQCSLEEIRTSLPEGTSLESAGQVVSTIMHIGDMLALAGEPGVPATVCCGEEHTKLHELAVRHFASHGMEGPELTMLKRPDMVLREETEGGNELDWNLMLSDRDPDVNRKVKKSFCEPENTDFCPPLSIVEHLLLPVKGEITVSRKPENGGDFVYTDIDALRQDFASGDLHPGDLKPAVGKAVNAVMADVRTGLKKNELKQAQKKLDTLFKQLQKKKKVAA